MPSLGADMDAGRLLEWYVKPGDAVKRGDIVALVDTDKAAIEVEIFEDGVVGELLVPPGEQVPVGTPLATILPPGTVAEAAAPVAGEEKAAAAEVGAAEVGAPAVTPAVAPAAAPAPQPAAPAVAAVASRQHAPATPAARNHARALGIDLDELKGSGKHGVITCQDVDAAARAAEVAVAAATPAATPEVAAAVAPGAAEAEAAPAGQRAVPAERPPVPAAAEPAAAPEGPPPTVAARPRTHVRASPLARRLAAELGIDLAGVEGSGPGGAVTQEDVRAASHAETAAVAAPAATPAAAPGATVPRAEAGKPEDARYAAMRRAIAAAMSKSKREIPHYYLSLHVDMTRPLAWLEDANLQRAVTERVLPAALILKATALAARDVPDVNGFYLEDGFHPSEAVHLGVGISLRQGGLIAPAIHDADAKDLDTLMADLRDLVKRTRSLQLRSSELSDATMTTTNLGDQGVESVYGIIYPPQVALVGYGRILERPWAENGMLAVRKQMLITLAGDHRASDGHRGGLFLSAIERHLQHPEEL